MTTAQIETCERLDWCVHECDDEIELEKYSPAGEDFIVSITDIDDIPRAVWEYANDFDVDDHIEMWVLARRSGVRGIPPMTELVEDAGAIRDMLHELADALSDCE